MRIAQLAAVAILVLSGAADAEYQTVTSYRNIFDDLAHGWAQKGAPELAALVNRAESVWNGMTPADRALDEMRRLHSQTPLFWSRAKAVQAKDRAVLLLVRGRNSSTGDYASAEAAAEWFTLAIEAWDEAFKIAPDLRGELVKIDDWKGQQKSAADWRATAKQKIDEL